ncbi:glycine/sarcosine/betaine reductase selenoprotein B family protein [Acidisphaera sp. L21]|uniref:glycine/sarcosine/betaine reductase selenoprotein B family protein n=1 Tax=Acidisphaera sp. L21 TaxID=1641851 RepID=UPI001C205AD0|nr:glycine/sarcosine/betaine reductase selenoprotein B family protein [Acidisphaera sp. L21]
MPNAFSPGFSPDSDRPIPYMDRTRDFYRAIGFTVPYRWASFAEVPFTPLHKTLAESCVALITTAAPFDPAKGDQGPGAPYNSAAKFFTVYSGDTAAEHDLRISHVTYDRTHTSAVDQASYFPLRALRDAVVAGRIGRVAARFHGAPTNRSHRATITTDAPEIVRRSQEDGVDIAVLVPNCPVCHQTLSLVARQLEAAGIPTVIMGCAKDIVEHCGVPRFLFSDFPLGNGAGKPGDRSTQDFTLGLALRVLETAPGSRTTVQSPLRWADDAAWKLDFSNVDRIAPEELERQRAEFLAQKAVAHAVRAAS